MLLWYHRIIRTENVKFLLPSSLFSIQGIPEIVLRLYFSKLHLFVGMYCNTSPLPVVIGLAMTSVHGDSQHGCYGAEVWLQRAATNPGSPKYL